MIAKVLGSVASFTGSAAYCLHDRAEEGEPRPETAERVEWTDTRNLPTSRADRATAVMAATAESAPELKRLAGVPLTGRKLQKPAYHFTLNWAKDETPGRQEMSRAVDESMKALGLEKHQALIVAHNDRAHAHVHVLVNRVSMDTGKAANLVRDRLTLSKWAEDYERRQGRIRCEKRVKNNAERRRGEWVRHRGSLPTGRYRRERMNPEREPRPEPIPPATEPAAQQKVAWLRWRGTTRVWRTWQRERRWLLEELERRCGREWSRGLRPAGPGAGAAGGRPGAAVWGRLAACGSEGRKPLRRSSPRTCEGDRRHSGGEQEDLEQHAPGASGRSWQNVHGTRRRGRSRRPAGERLPEGSLRDPGEMGRSGGEWSGRRVGTLWRHPMASAIGSASSRCAEYMGEAWWDQAREVGGEAEVQRQRQASRRRCWPARSAWRPRGRQRKRSSRGGRRPRGRRRSRGARSANGSIAAETSDPAGDGGCETQALSPYVGNQRGGQPSDRARGAAGGRSGGDARA